MTTTRQPFKYGAITVLHETPGVLEHPGRRFLESGLGYWWNTNEKYKVTHLDSGFALTPVEHDTEYSVQLHIRALASLKVDWNQSYNALLDVFEPVDQLRKLYQLDAMFSLIDDTEDDLLKLEAEVRKNIPELPEELIQEFKAYWKACAENMQEE